MTLDAKPYRTKLVAGSSLLLGALVSTLAFSQPKPKTGCGALPDHARLKTALQAIVRTGKQKTTGLGNQRWAAIVNRDGVVCAVAYSGESRSDQWPGSRAIAAEKASTANALSNPSFAMASGNLYAATQPGQSLYGLVNTAPPNPDAAYSGDAAHFGQPNDPMVGKPVGGMVVFGGGLAVYDDSGQILGGVGVSGDTSCSDHVVAWRLRHELKLDRVPGGVANNLSDNLVLDIQNGVSPSGYGHPSCKGGVPSDEVIRKLPETDPLAHKPMSRR